LKCLKSRPKELKGLKPFLVKEDKEYKYSKIEFFIKNKNLYIKLSGYKVKTKWFVLENYGKYTALQIISKFYDCGRHFEDGILEIWKREGIKLGWIKEG
jgi:hypothetical protein